MSDMEFIVIDGVLYVRGPFSLHCYEDGDFTPIIHDLAEAIEPCES